MEEDLTCTSHLLSAYSSLTTTITLVRARPTDWVLDSGRPIGFLIVGVELGFLIVGVEIGIQVSNYGSDVDDDGHFESDDYEYDDSDEYLEAALLMTGV
ncbi:hypothetical protein QVD17_14986 [Tagetes erecta]|uniref:Uncharacterized protein n=1 Tax=Tagetes erecta TaxID=13708 RepID=A0AAD8NS81_TARER|nr:hypothetical protein QVD17_14986 [Tagetes erecta]